MTVISGVSEALMSSGTGNTNTISAVQENELKVTESFMNLMSGYGARSEADINVSKDIIEVKDDSEAYESTKTFTSVNNSKISKPEDKQTYEVTEEDVSAVKQFGEDIKKLIEDKLGVTDEELVMAMQNLGLTMADLMEPSNLTNLLSEVTNSESVEELLTVSGIGEIMKGVNELTSNLSNELMVEPEQMVEIVDFVNQMEIVSPEVVEDNPETQMTVEIPVNDSMIDELGITNVNISSTNQVEEAEYPVSEVVSQIATETVTVSTEDVEEVDKTDKDAEETEESAVKAKAEGTETPENQSPVQKKINSEEKNDTSNDKGFDNSSRFTRQDVNVEVKADGQIETVVKTEEVHFDGYVDTEDIISQIISQARTMNAQTISSIEMQLNPESLGKILLQVTEKEGQIRAQIMTQNESVKQAIESQMADFKVNMNQLGIKVDAVEVTVSSHAFEENLEGNFNQDAEDNQSEAQTHERRNLNLSMLEDEDIDLSEEERIAANIMRDNGNQMDVIA